MAATAARPTERTAPRRIHHSAAAPPLWLHRPPTPEPDKCCPSAEEMELNSCEHQEAEERLEVPLTSGMVAVVALVVLPLVFERQLVAQGGGQRQQASGAGPWSQGRLEPRRVGRQRDGDGVAVGKVVRLQLLLLDRQKEPPLPSNHCRCRRVCACVCVTHPYDGVELGHGDLLGSLHRLNHLLLML